MRTAFIVFVVVQALALAGISPETALRHGLEARNGESGAQTSRFGIVVPPTSEEDAPFTEVWNLTIAGFPQAPYTVGACVVGDKLWVTSGGTGTGGELAVISIYDLNNTPPSFIERIYQPVATYGWGMRDMAYNPVRGEVYATGTQNRELLVIDVPTRTLKWRRTLSDPAPTLLRTMAWDGLDSLHTTDGTDPLVKFHPDPPYNPRRWIEVLPTGHTAFGAAINPVDRHMWFYNETSSDPNKLVRYDWPEMANRRVFPVTGASTSGGGCDMWGTDYLIVVDQNEPYDVIRCLLVRPFTNDLAVTAIERPTFFGEFPEPFLPRAVVRNRGTAAQSDFKVRCLILDEDLVPVCDETLFITTPLGRGESRILNFPTWESPEQGEGYRCVVSTLLAGDEDPTNNELTAVFNVAISLEARWDNMRQPPDPSAGKAWPDEGCGWLHAFPNYWDEVYITGAKTALFNSSWPAPGGNRFRVVVRDNSGPNGAPGAELYNSGILTGTRGAWNTHIFPISIPYSRGRWYVEYNQVGNYPNCPGLTIDGVRNSPPDRTQWQKAAGVFSTDYQRSGDWGIRGFIVKPPVRDVGVTAIIRPSPVVVAGAAVYPRVRVQNYGNIAVGPFAVRCIITREGNQEVVFDKREQVASIAPGATILFDFTNEYWPAGPVGNFRVRCSTELTGDNSPGNDQQALAFTVVPALLDVGVARVHMPTGTIAERTRVFPKMLIQNYGNVDAGPFRIRCVITRQGSSIPVFDKQEELAGLASGGTVEFEFKDSVWVAGPVARFRVRCTTELAGDEESLNDWCDENFKVSPSWPLRWREAAPVLGAPSPVPVNAGGWLAIGPDKNEGDAIYSGKGYKTTDFYKYRPYEGVNGTWYILAPIPDTIEGKLKPPSKGTRGVCVTEEQFLYLTRGNNTLGFCRYDIQNGLWEQKKDVPTGSSKKKVKGGEDMVVVKEDGVEWIYLLKGGDTDFYRYNTATDEWDESLPDVPYGGGKPKYNRGSFLVYDGTNTIYAHQAKLNDGTNHYMFKYDVAAKTWQQQPLKGMPVADVEGGKLKKKKSGEGGAGAWYGNKLYALKGGNTSAFYCYDPATGVWTPLDIVPILGSTEKRKRVKAGGDLVYFAERGFFALKGNKTSEFWRYVEPATDDAHTAPETREGMQTSGGSTQLPAFIIAPNPLVGGFAAVRFSLPKPGPATFTVFDVVGRQVLRQTYSVGRNVHCATLDCRRFASGVYLIRLDAEGVSQTKKLVVKNKGSGE